MSAPSASSGPKGIVALSPDRPRTTTRPIARAINAPDVKTIAAIVREASATPIRNASFASPIPIPRGFTIARTKRMPPAIAPAAR